MTRIIILSLVGVLLLAALFSTNHYVPFQIEVVVVYLGIGIFVAGLLSVIKPFRIFHINSRKLALLLAAAGLLVFMAGMMLPSPMIRSSRPHQRIDDYMPEYQFYEYHDVTVNAPAEAVSKAVKKVAFTDIPIAIWLMRIRGMAEGQMAQPILEELTQPGTGFLALESSNPYEYVCGIVGKPWSQAMDWLAQLVTHIPNKGEQMVRYYGYYLNKSRGMRKKAGLDDQVPALTEAEISSTAFRRNLSTADPKNLCN